MPATLDPIALRSLTAIVDCGGFHRAAETLHISQSTVSQHIRKLEHVVGRPLLSRTGRTTRFTPDGELLIAEARLVLAAHDDALRRLGVDVTPAATITVGAVEHAADYLLPHVTRALTDAFPDAEIRFRLDRGRALANAIERSTVDVAILLGTATPDAVDAGSLPLAWFAAPDWRVPTRNKAVPVAVIDDPCTLRRHALRALAEDDRSSTVAAESGYLAGVLNAARAGIGVALLAHVGPTPAGLVACAGLPRVDPEPVHVRVRAGARPGLATTVGTAVTSALNSAVMA